MYWQAIHLVHIAHTLHMQCSAVYTWRLVTKSMPLPLPRLASWRARPLANQWPGMPHGATRTRSLPHSFSHGWWCGQIHFPCICELSYAGRAPSRRGSLSSLANSIQPSSLRLEHRCRI
ncbi:hypothetical protein COCMIDRAFT_37305 [Bipolaris oryzae ATCC 44560]|uniref:Uncharacterized protein n=1 Tax=Bipolaris oryzae ATCC 44560 TaxID=930090 RepID=W6ZBP0_COCMI|nr:uncharacterized protein COCMIDRAFT_37305 [Bipolaris oryzae ATCC 44560]EUC44869.1 hypothetical protein COCMIDRAFT_37305 [Bipolaris oryzae ATCC 44560]